eukprot:TRINITY_DN2473_c0_g1_i1.p1 TRINITY_DN2473_c0_g1~~TRINITY_DN2473_c0_g1_i1.p1  ORF type:complete len:389 (-),score=63.34 TRINITY_DN2473_c0_g1_i1:141-1307(-)
MEKSGSRKSSKKDSKKDSKKKKERNDSVGQYATAEAGETASEKFQIIWSYAEVEGASTSIKKSTAPKNSHFSTKIVAGTWRFDVWSTSKHLGSKGVLGLASQKIQIDALISVKDAAGSPIANATGALDETARQYSYRFEVGAQQAPAVVSMAFTSNSVLLGVEVSATLSKLERPLDDLADELNIFPEDMEVLMATFQKYGSGDGLLTFKEFEAAIAEVQNITYKSIFSPTYAKITWELVDSDGNGKIDATEFLVGVTVLASGTVEEKAKLSFKAFDKDGDGYLSRKELTHQLALACKVSDKIAAQGARESTLGSAIGLVAEGRRLGQSLAGPPALPKDELNRVFSICDSDNDGRISLEEWIDGAKQSSEIRRFFDPASRFQSTSRRSS